MANVLQSAAGEMAVIAIWSIVLAERCSDVVGSKRITFPCALPSLLSAQSSTAANPRRVCAHQRQHCRCASTRHM